MESPQHRLIIPADGTGRRLDQVLAELLPDYSRSRLKQWIVDGHVRLDGASPEPRTRVAEGQVVDIQVDDLAEADDGTRSPAAQAMPLSIIHEDDDVLVINKPAGLVVHPGAGNAAGTLQNGLLAYRPELAELPRSGILHRLDKDTSGLLIVAKTLIAHTHLVRALEARDITREYRALCVGPMTGGGLVDAPIGRHRTQRTKMAVMDFSGRPAVTHYRVLGRFPHHTFVAVRLETGRTHQIRVHLAHVRHPIVGDPTYGGRLIVPAGATGQLALALRAFRRQALHAHRIRFQHPVNNTPIDLSAPLPDDFRALLAALLNTPAGDDDAVARLEALPWPEQPST
ncbi:MAG: 23S rRNA pseudouridine(1911/1915/1917) synthase RluD [Chromatiales bacterium]|nr:MAG: 23S rRNA pseudouridine(1911/1915/1917) synthase RluD [Chromatiales bacterium]